ncbi:MAG: hypothetical protein AAF219_09125 [Myxococcota bacterium]
MRSLFVLRTPRLEEALVFFALDPRATCFFIDALDTFLRLTVVEAAFFAPLVRPALFFAIWYSFISMYGKLPYVCNCL